MSDVGQYRTGRAEQQIRQALIDAGKRPDRLDPNDLALIEDFHSSGRLATAALIELAALTPADAVLDAGAGIGGTARLIASQLGAHVTAVDLTPEFCEIADWLNAACGLDRQIDVRQADVLDLPFDAGRFDVVISQHVQMNVAAKDDMYREARRVLKRDGRLAIWDVVAGDRGPLELPVPWADIPERSHLVTPEQLQATLARNGFRAVAWNDLTDQSVAFMREFSAMPRPPLGLHVFVPDFQRKIENLVANLDQDRARLIQAVLRAA